MTLHVKNMVSTCSKKVVQSELKKLGLNLTSVELGVVEIADPITDVQLGKVRDALKKFGLELMEDKKAILVERIKKLVLGIVYSPEFTRKIHFSDYLRRKLHYNYTYLSGLFSEVAGITIEQYLISSRIERVKELLSYDEFTLKEISFRLNYSSVAHLSNQFKKITGVAPSEFKKMEKKPRYAMDEV